MAHDEAFTSNQSRIATFCAQGGQRYRIATPLVVYPLQGILWPGSWKERTTLKHGMPV